MTAPKHTPGPWRAVCRSSSYVEGQEWDEDEFLQWEVHGMRCPRGRGDYFQADAHLIAAAPELYEALTQAFEREYNPFEPDNQSDRYHRWGALLAKARGEANG